MSNCNKPFQAPCVGAPWGFSYKDTQGPQHSRLQCTSREVLSRRSWCVLVTPWPELPWSCHSKVRTRHLQLPSAPTQKSLVDLFISTLWTPYPRHWLSLIWCPLKQKLWGGSTSCWPQNKSTRRASILAQLFNSNSYLPTSLWTTNSKTQKEKQR